MTSQRSSGLRVHSQNTKKSRLENSQSSRIEDSQGFSQRSRVDDLTEEQLEAAVQNVTEFLLCEMRSKRRIRKEDIVTIALNKKSRQFTEILRKAQANLSNVFGLLITKVPQHNDVFIVVNKHRPRFIDMTLLFSTDNVQDVQDDVILSVVLASIFMNRGQMFESHLMTILETIGFLSERFYDSDCPPRIKDYVTNLVKKTFVKQMYLDAEVIPRPQQAQNPPLPENEFKVTLYKWGYRAMLEVKLEKLNEYLVKMYDGIRPPGFPTSYYNELKTNQQQLLQSISL